MDAVELWSQACLEDGVAASETRKAAVRGMLEELRALDKSMGDLQAIAKGGIVRLGLYKLECLDCFQLLCGARLGSQRNGWSLLSLFRTAWPSRARAEALSRLQDMKQAREEAVRRLGNALHNVNVPIPLNEPPLLYRPTWISRYMLPVLCTTGLSLVLIRFVRRIDWAFVLDVAKDLYAASQNLFRDWIVDPMVDIWRTVRYRNTNLALASATALQADVDSLERMVVSFARKQYPDIPEPAVVDQVRRGDVTLILRKYEEELASPLKNALMGDLVSMLLIQVQKSKVDLEAAMLAIDRLLKANELNFELLAVIPLLVLLYSVLGAGRRRIKGWLRRSERYHLVNLRRKMHNLERVLNSNVDGAQLLGETLLAVQSMVEDANQLSRRSKYGYENEFYEDLREILSNQLGAERKLWTMTRIHRYFPFLHEK